MAEEPAPARSWVGVTAIEKMSPAHAILYQLAADGGVAEKIIPWSIVFVVRYCFDWKTSLSGLFGPGEGASTYHFQIPLALPRLKLRVAFREVGPFKAGCLAWSSTLLKDVKYLHTSQRQILEGTHHLRPICGNAGSFGIEGPMDYI